MEASKNFMDRLGIQPCGHSARKAGILLKVYTSCLPQQIGSSLLYFARGCGNDKNTGALFLRADSEIARDQNTCGLDFTRITCGESVHEECRLCPDYTYAKQKEMDYIYLISWSNRGKKAWQLVLLMEAPEIIDLFEEKLRRRYKRSQTVNVKDFGVVLKSGFGEDPPQEVKDWLRRILMGFETLQY